MIIRPKKEKDKGKGEGEEHKPSLCRIQSQSGFIIVINQVSTYIRQGRKR